MINNKLGLYIHLPFCKKRCNYCTFISSTDYSIEDIYIVALLKEIEESSIKYKDKYFDTIYFGGGTPSSLKSSNIRKLIDKIRNSFNIEDKSEITFEINPESCNDDLLKTLKICNVNRISMGLQSDSDVILKEIGRIHDFNQFDCAYKKIVEHDFNNISVDLMLGLKGQDRKNLKKTIDYIKNLKNLKHLSMYSLILEEDSLLFKQGYTVDEDYSASLYEFMNEQIIKLGFNRYETSNYAISGYESKHNQKYWDLTQYLGLGLSAHSFIEDRRIENTSNMQNYINQNFISNIIHLTKEDMIEEYIMLSLRTKNGMDLTSLKNKFNYDLSLNKKTEIEFLLKHNLIVINNNFLKITDENFYIANSIILKLV